jgi:hypothetical protein
MRRFLKDSISPSMGVALLALVLAASGTGYAAVQLAHNSVGSAQIRDHSVTAVDLKAPHPVKAAQPVLQPGQIMRGYFAGGGSDGVSGYFGEGITFPAKLPPNFDNNHVRYLTAGSPPTTRCPGPGTAKRGWMCFYEGQSNAASLCCIYDQNYNSPATADFGLRIYWDVVGASSYADGQWVVRAP